MLRWAIAWAAVSLNKPEFLILIMLTAFIDLLIVLVIAAGITEFFAKKGA